MTAAPPVPPPPPPPPPAPSHENNNNNAVNPMPAPGPVNMNMNMNMPVPRFHPIAMNPNQPPPPEFIPNHPPFRPFPVHDPHGQHHPPPPGAGPGPVPAPPTGPLDHVEARLKQLEHEDAARSAARSHMLVMRKREDEEFRRVTENAELEEEDLRRQRKRLKRESMGLGFNAAVMDSPPLRPTPPRRLSETNAATTLAFFKQQSPRDARPPPGPSSSGPILGPVSGPPASTPGPVPGPIHTPIPQIPPPHPHPQHIPQDPLPAVSGPGSGSGSIRRKQKYTIKNIEAWGERHGRPTTYDPSGRALWKRPSDGNLVYLTCPVDGCGKADFVTLHGFMCHLTKKHKDRSLGSQSRALEVCGVGYDPSKPLPVAGPGFGGKRASTEESPGESELEGEQLEGAGEESGEEMVVEDREREGESAVKMEESDEVRIGNGNEVPKQSISSIIDQPDEQTDLSEKENNEPR